MSRKLYHLHLHTWITLPDAKTGFSKLGITDYALKYFLRFNKMDFSDFPKTKYGINNSTLISLFVKETKTKYEDQLLMKQKQKQDPQATLPSKDSLTLSQKMQYDRFLIKRNQSYSILKTYEYDIELTAPIDMRVVDQNFDMFYSNRILTIPYFFQIQCLNTNQLHDLISEEQYVKSAKFFQFC